MLVKIKKKQTNNWASGTKH